MYLNYVRYPSIIYDYRHIYSNQQFKTLFHVVDFSQIMNVDFSHVEAKVNEMLKSDHSISLLQGELISR